MKKTVVILLLSLLLLNTSCYYLVYAMDLALVKEDAEAAKESADENHTVTLTFPYHNNQVVAKDLSMTDEDELSYQGKMYDVISTSKYDGYISFKCYADNDETALNANLSGKIDSDKDQSSNSHKNRIEIKDWLKVYTSGYQYTSNTLSCLFHTYTPIDKKLKRLSVYGTVVSPPPEEAHS